MAVAIAKERWTMKVTEMVIGPESATVKVGGESTLPFLQFEGEMPNRPVVALEVFDMEPDDWPEVLASAYDGVMNDPVAWARKCVEYGADMVCLRLVSAHPDKRDASPEQAAATARAVAAAVSVPLIVLGCGAEEKDGKILLAVGEALSGKNCVLGLATLNNYRPISASCMVHGHNIIASSPLDINLAKQLNILINEMNLPLDRILIDPSVGALGYGMEYAYSIIEHARLGALTGDRMTAVPVVCLVGEEAWKTREARTGDNEEWGPAADRAILWETTTATTLAIAGGNVFIMRHPQSVRRLNAFITEAMKSKGY